MEPSSLQMKEYNTKENKEKLYASVWGFQDTLNAALFLKRIYKVVSEIVQEPTGIRPLNFVLDTGSKSNLIHYDVMSIEWEQAVKPENNSQLKRSINHKLFLMGTIILHLRRGESRVWAYFGVLCQLIVSILLGTSFVDKIVRGGFSEENGAT